MDNHVHDTVADRNTTAAAIAAHPSKTPHKSWKGWKSCLGDFWCFPKRKHVKCIVPAKQLADESTKGSEDGMANNESLLSSVSNEAAASSPVSNGPPPSPASFLNSENPSCVQSPAALFLCLASTSGIECSQAGLQLDFSSSSKLTQLHAQGPVLLTPPILSTLTTAPTTPLSTAPFTPPPELAHLTTPPSPDVPFAEMLCSSTDAEGSFLAPSGELPASLNFPFVDLALAYQLHPGSPVGHLVSPRSGASGSGTLSPLPEMGFSRQSNLKLAGSTSSLSMVECTHLFGRAHAAGHHFRHCRDIMQDRQCTRGDEQVHSDGAQFANTVEGSKKAGQKEPTCYSSNNGTMQESKKNAFKTISSFDTRHDEILDSAHRVKATYSMSADNVWHNTIVKHPRLTTEVISDRFHEHFDSCRSVKSKNDETYEVNELHQLQLTHQLGKLAESNPLPLAVSSPYEDTLVNKCGKGLNIGTSNGEACFCSKCGELKSRCRVLSEALQQAKDRLIVIESKHLPQ